MWAGIDDVPIVHPSVGLLDEATIYIDRPDPAIDEGLIVNTVY